MQKFKKNNYLYTSLFCEENIWHLTQSLISQGIEENNINILFLSNEIRKIAIFNQLAANHDEIVVWDYHVILLAKTEGSLKVFDFDTRLPFPTDIDDYLHRSLPDNIHNEYSSQFRLIPASKYIDFFYSDRSHMKNMISESLYPSSPLILSDSQYKMILTDLFNIEKTIKHTSIFKNKGQLINWVAEQ